VPQSSTKTGFQARFRSSRRERGFTIIELLVTMSVAILVIVAASMSLGSLFRADLKTGSGQVAASIRYLYSLSVLNNQSYRLVVDLESHEYWGEEMPREGRACDVFLVEKEGDSNMPDLPSRKKRGSGSSRDGSDEEGEAQVDGTFEVLKDNLLKRRRLPGRLKFTGVITAHHGDLQEEGRAEINFFPAGYVEHAYIYVGEEEDIYTIESVSLMGTAEIHREKRQPGSLFETR
jgi:hypothetical protein